MKLGNTEVKLFVEKICNEQLSHWLRGRTRLSENRCEQGGLVGAGRLAARKARQLCGARARPPTGCPASWRMAGSTHPKSPSCMWWRSSAGGSAERRPRLRRLLPLRGKIINVEKARIDRVLKNTEVQAIIMALCTGIHDEFDIAKLRYHKIVLMADADVDGQHISTLLLTLLFRFMKPLVENGQTALYAAAVQTQVAAHRAAVCLFRPRARRPARGGIEGR